MDVSDISNVSDAFLINLQYKRAQYQITNLLDTAKYSEKSSRERFGFVKVSYAKNESRIRIFWSDSLT